VDEQEQEEQPRGYGPVTAIAMIAAGALLAFGVIALTWIRPHAHAATPPAAPPMPPGAITYQPPLNDVAPPMVHTGGFADWVASWPMWVTWAAPSAFLLIVVTLFTWAAAHFIDAPERKHRKAPEPAGAAQPRPAASNGSDIWYPLYGDTDSFSIRAIERALNGQEPTPAPR